jgi:tetrahydromethanopterin S-methyltransferase subunit B
VSAYSNKPLAEKLGIKAGAEVLAVSPPEHYEALLGRVPEGVRVSQELEGSFDVIQVFVKTRSRLETIFDNLKAHLNPGGALWVSWPKRSAKVETDLNENVVMAVGLASGLVDVKVISIDETWSGLKFVYRLKDR